MTVVDGDRPPFRPAGPEVELSDRCDLVGRWVVRLVPNDPIGAQLAVHAVGLGQLGGALLIEERELVAAVAGTVAEGMSVLSAGLVELANSGQPLTDRQKAILVHLAAGVPHLLIARRMYLSLSTLKRELRTIRSLVSATDDPATDSRDESASLRDLLSFLNSAEGGR
ncbi:MAG: hypothetical protein ACFCVK_10065 [Acidimicrobiales bacterium]